LCKVILASVLWEYNNSGDVVKKTRKLLFLEGLVSPGDWFSVTSSAGEDQQSKQKDSGR
jgi:hypothetical protein